MNQDSFSRRRFLAGVGQGTLIATIGPSLAIDLGLAPRTLAAEESKALDFGDLEPLVRYLQETPVTKLQSGLADRLRAGTPLKELIAAGALANSRTFGGEDYIGYHTFMALAPALHMASLLPEKEQALPVFKVLYRNTNRIGENGGRSAEVLHPVTSPPDSEPGTTTQLVEAIKGKREEEAEQLFAGMMSRGTASSFDSLLYAVQENLEVHRTVLPYRAWQMIDLVGEKYASALLRQSLRYCLDSEGGRRPDWDVHGKILTALLDEHQLLGRAPGEKEAEDTYVEELSRTIFNGTPEIAAAAVAAALAEGFRPSVIGEAISLATNQIVLRDPGRIPAWEFPGKVVGSVHGDSVGVHASDSANAWRNLARVSQGRNTFACLILGAWQAARDRGARSGLLEADPVPTKRQIGEVTEKDATKLLAQLDEAVRAKLQSRAAAVVHQYSQLGLPEGPVFDRLLRFGVSEDGALHAEKYFHTAWDDFHSTRPTFRWRHLTGLARVTASEYGYPAPGQEEARELLHV
ncbi:MAG: hypothetical protein KBF76_15825 [Verrucomicrobiales bacterium]|nr:hypothetical protein [Verrucomicrobiales bacterium]